MAESIIITGQFVRIRQTPASIGERLVALCIDGFVVACYLIGMSLLLSKLDVHAFSGVSFFFLFGFVYLPALAYPLLCEVFNRGQSLGKLLLHLRVVKIDGSTPNLGAYLLRWLLFLVDVPLTGGLGLLVALFNKNSQRLGDLSAGTMVIKEKNYRKIQVSLDEFDYLAKGYCPIYPQAAGLSLEQVNVITKTLTSRQADADQRIGQLTEKVRALLAVSPTETSNEKFLQTVLRDYQYYALEEI